MLLIAGPPTLRRSALDRIAGSRYPAYGPALATYGRALQQRNGLLRAIREEGADRADLRYWDRPFLDAGGEVVAARLRLLDELAEPLAAAHAEIAPDEAARSPLRLRYATNAPAAARGGAAGCARPPPRRDRGEGGLERDDAGRPAPGRPVVRARRARPRRLRLARPAADGDPRLQARRAGSPDRARRTPAAPPARRRLLRAGPGAEVPPRQANRRAATGVRDHDDARRPRPGAPGDRDDVAGRPVRDRRVARRAGRRRRGILGPAGDGPRERGTAPARPDVPDRRPHPGGGRPPGPRGRAPARARRGHVRRDRRRASSGCPRCVPRAARGGGGADRRGGRADRGPGAATPGTPAGRCLPDGASRRPDLRDPRYGARSAARLPGAESAPSSCDNPGPGHPPRPGRGLLWPSGSR